MCITVVVTVTSTHTNAHTTPTEPHTFICNDGKIREEGERRGGMKRVYRVIGTLTKSPYLCFRLASNMVNRPIRINWKSTLRVIMNFV